MKVARMRQQIKANIARAAANIQKVLTSYYLSINPLLAQYLPTTSSVLAEY